MRHRHKYVMAVHRKEIVDRRLLIFSSLTFVAEVLLFLADVGAIPISFWPSGYSASERPAIGEIEIARQNVRRRGFDSSVWEDSTRRDSLFENDSVLTLTESAARLKLKGNVTLELHENTLVVLEPSSDEDDKPFRLHFSRGDLRAATTEAGVHLRTGAWSIKAAAGSDLSLRSVDAEHVEVAVKTGEVQVQNSESGKAQSVNQDQKLTISPQEIGELLTANPALAWGDPAEKRIYSHEFPISALLTWQGEANELQILSAGQGLKTLPLEAKSQEIALALGPGNHHLTLKHGQEISKTLTLQVIRAPKIIHLTPLPRDRVKTNTPVLFAWLSEYPASEYRLEVASDDKFQDILLTQSVKEAKIETALPEAGQLYWRIEAFDENQFLIPASYSYPIISHPDPLAPPKLRAPTAVEETGDDEASLRPRPQSIWETLADWLIPRAHGEGATSNAKLPPVIFNWEAIAGADFYVIEISSTVDFQNPDVIARSSTTFYAWTEFKRGIYYYRVAGGSRSGRVGIFSTPEKVDLTNWPPPNLKPKKPKPKIIAKAPPLRPAMPPPSPLPAPKSEVVPPRPPASAEPSPAPPNLKTLGAVYWRGLWRSTQVTAPDQVKAEFVGTTPLALGGELEWPRNGGWWHERAELTQYRWRPKSSGTWPFQDQLTELNWSLLSLLSSSPSGWSFGFGSGQETVIKRDDLETVKLNAVFWVGPAMEYQQRETGKTRLHDLTLMWSPDQVGLTNQNRWRWAVWERLTIGAELNFQYQLGSGRTSWTMEAGLQTGWTW